MTTSLPINIKFEKKKQGTMIVTKASHQRNLKVFVVFGQLKETLEIFNPRQQIAFFLDIKHATAFEDILNQKLKDQIDRDTPFSCFLVDKIDISKVDTESHQLLFTSGNLFGYDLFPKILESFFIRGGWNESKLSDLKETLYTLFQPFESLAPSTYRIEKIVTISKKIFVC